MECRIGFHRVVYDTRPQLNDRKNRFGEKQNGALRSPDGLSATDKLGV
jgi:hypothetical protein